VSAVDAVVGEVTATGPPVLVSIDGGEATATQCLGVWTPTIGDRVLVLVNATTRARLYALGPI